jgi:hypothetical protein
MQRAMNEFVHHCNIANYRRLLRDNPDPERRRVLMSLLDEAFVAAQKNGWLSGGLEAPAGLGALADAVGDPVGHGRRSAAPGAGLDHIE